jgi:hypothetical protein
MQTTGPTSFLKLKTFKLLSWCASTALLIGGLVHADIVTGWNTVALDAIRDGHTAPPIAFRSLAKSITRLKYDCLG